MLFFSPLKDYIPFCMPPPFVQVRPFLCYQNFCNIIHLEEKLARYFAILNAFPTAYSPLGKGYFVPFYIVMRGGNMALNIDIILNAYITEYCCNHQTNISQVHDCFSSLSFLCGLGK